MVAAILSRVVIVVAGILYPAYSSFKAVRARSHREYTQWMMYWIVFALFQAVEVVTDTFIPWMPLYYELKIVLVLWLVLPITQGSKQLYRVMVHPFLVKHETQIDEYVHHFGEKGMSAIRRVSRQGLNLAASTVVTSAIKGQAVITETLLKAQQQQEEQTPDGGEAGGGGGGGGGGAGAGAGGEGRGRERAENGRPYHPSTSSYHSEDFEVIEEEPETYEDPPSSPLSHPATPPLDGHTHSPTDTTGLYHRT